MSDTLREIQRSGLIIPGAPQLEDQQLLVLRKASNGFQADMVQAGPYPNVIYVFNDPKEFVQHIIERFNLEGKVQITRIVQ